MEPPPPSSLPPSLPGHLRFFLDAHFKVPDDLPRAPTLAANLEKNCRVLDRDLALLAERLDGAVRRWAAPLEDAGVILRRERLEIGEWKKLCSSTHLGDGGAGEMGRTRVGRVLGVELPLLAKVVRRIETARLYAETSLRLEALVGDLEDATLCHMGQNSSSTVSVNSSNTYSPTDFRYKQEKLLAAIKAMRDIEGVLITIVKDRPHWSCLIAAVDSRVEKNLAILRPQSLRDHRAILSSLGWPPSLSSNAEKESAEIPNPLVLMLADKKENFSQSFLALCSLQHLQACRDLRQRNYSMLRDGDLQDFVEASDMVCLDHNLWTFDELVFPLASRMEHHFSRWFEEPKFIFGLVYKTTRDFLEGVDNVLQPLIDKARLVGYSAKEAWVLAMVKMLSAYLTSRVFPALAKTYDVDSENSDVISSWLHLIDLVISFDKRMVALAISEVVLKGVPSNFAGNPLPMLLFLIFHDHSDWLQIWAEVELRDAEGRLKSELEDEAVWAIVVNKEAKSINGKEGENFLLSTREDYKAPPFADSIIKIAWAMIERCQTLPSFSMRLQFIRSSACILLRWFYQVLLQRCQVKDPTAAIMGDEVLLRVIGSVNAARYCESVMQEWGEDLSLVELSIFAKNDDMGGRNDETDQTFFHDEIKNMVKLETDCLVDILSSFLLEFEFFSRDYIQNKIHWEVGAMEFEIVEVSDLEQMSVSNTFVESLDMLKERLATLKSSLNFKDFADFWRSSASGLDHFIFNSIVLNNVKFSCSGVHQFEIDMRALFLVFKPFCARPEAFFPCISDSLKLLVMPWENLIGDRSQHERRIRDCLHLHGVSHVSPSEAHKILSNRKFAD